MVLEVLRRLLSPRKQKRRRKVYAVLDASGQYVTLNDGERIPVKNILSIDPASGIIIYRSRDGRIKKARVVGEPEEAGERRVGVALATAILLLAALLPVVPARAETPVFYVLVANNTPYAGYDVIVPVFIANTSISDYQAIASAPLNLHFELPNGTPLYWYLCYAGPDSIRVAIQIPYIGPYEDLLIYAYVAPQPDPYMNETVVFDEVIDFSSSWRQPDWVTYGGAWEIVNGELHLPGGYDGWLAWSMQTSAGAASPFVVVEFRDEVYGNNAGFSLFLIQDANNYDTANLDGNVVLYITAVRGGTARDLGATVVEYGRLDPASICLIGPVLDITTARTCFAWDAKFYQLWFDVADVGTISYSYVGVGYYLAESSLEDVYVQRILVGRTVPGGLQSTVLDVLPDLAPAEKITEIDTSSEKMIDTFLFVLPAAALVLYFLPRSLRRPRKALIENAGMTLLELLVYVARAKIPVATIENATGTFIQYSTNTFSYLHLLLAFMYLALAFVALANVAVSTSRRGYRVLG